MALDAATAALIGAALGSGGTLLTAWLNPFSTAKHAREAKYLEMRRDAYADGLKVIHKFTITDMSVNALDDLAFQMLGPFVQMRLHGSPDIAELYSDVIQAFRAVAEDVKRHGGDTEQESTQQLAAKGTEAIDAFVEAARADIGIAGLYHE